MSLKRLSSWRLDLMIWVLSTIALAACAVLEYLAQYKAGVMKHLYYRKMEHMVGIFSSDLLPYHWGVALAMFVIAAFLGRARHVSRSFALSLMSASGLLVTVLYASGLQELYSYTYILLTLETTMVAFAIWLLMNVLLRNYRQAVTVV